MSKQLRTASCKETFTSGSNVFEQDCPYSYKRIDDPEINENIIYQVFINQDEYEIFSEVQFHKHFTHEQRG